MKTNRTIRYRLHPATYGKHQQLHGTAGACRHMWNHFVAKLQDKYQYYEESNFNFGELSSQFTTLREHCDTWLQNYSPHIVRKSLKPIRNFSKETTDCRSFTGETAMRRRGGLTWDCWKSMSFLYSHNVTYMWRGGLIWGGWKSTVIA